MFALSGERNLLSSLGSYIPPQPLVPLQVWAYTTTSQDSRKPRAWKHLLCRKIQKQCTQQEHSGRKAAPESSEKTDCNLCHWMQQQNQIFTDRRVRRNHVVQLYCISRSQRGFQDHSLQRTYPQDVQVIVLFSFVSHLSQTHLKTEKKRDFMEVVTTQLRWHSGDTPTALAH